MLDFVWFMTFSILEGLGVYYYIFKLFRFKESFINLKVLLINFTISLIAYGTTIYGHSEIVPLIQIIIVISSIAICYGVNLLYALKMGVTGYISYLIVNVFSTIILGYLKIVDLNNVNEFSVGAYTLQTTSFIFIYLVTFLIRKNTIGYTYIPIDKVNLQMNHANIFILSTSIISFLFMTVAAVTTINDKKIIYLEIVAVIIVLCFLLLLLSSNKKEQEDD